jgi:hypothetical protein
MEELIFFAVIIFFSIIESIARSRKKKSGGSAQIPHEWEPDAGRDTRRGRAAPTPGGPAYEAPTYGTASYDSDRSYDELEVEEADSREVLPEATASRSGSEGMIPADIWEEIEGLARGRMRELETRPEPRASPPAPLPPARLGWGKRAPSVGPTHRAHLAHQGYGTDPSERAPSALDGLDPLARSLSADAAAVRSQLRPGGRHALRRAVILREILGPPASLRPEEFRD